MAMEEALYEIASTRAFACLSLNEAIPDGAPTLSFRYLLEENDLAEDVLKLVNTHLPKKGLLLKQHGGCRLRAAANRHDHDDQ